jgi:lanosterol synthase
VSDCAAEGLKAALALQSLSYTNEAITIDRMKDCVDTILSMQNPNGGYASYELQRGSERMEYLNASEVFGSIMVDYLYPESVQTYQP